MRKIALIHIREDRKELEFERQIFLKKSGLKEEELISINSFEDNLPKNPSLFNAVVIGGSKLSVAENDEPSHPKNLKDLVSFLKNIYKEKIPFLGLCFGAQLLAVSFGGKVLRDKKKDEHGTFLISKTKQADYDLLLQDLPQKFMAQCAHHDYIAEIPDGAVILAKSKKCDIQGFRLGRTIYGFQFHPERSQEDFAFLTKMRFEDYGDKTEISKLAPSAEAEKILRKFVDIFSI